MEQDGGLPCSVSKTAALNVGSLPGDVFVAVGQKKRDRASIDEIQVRLIVMNG